ncbi:hypothetical protein BAUCODRAFT_38499 [Baudoinia panamericana UAMH 10762]|uniref:Uncharacterized protein n=1 Tax=Baudoinia panamericana (strain UAMH 10762) TaxID=717646 RepID=M2LEL7_BAUPA|nr:uncharacterized protein BAUCODRAFT_38499 [Baudoinia panamericana UAMH 10762]EMC92437.1 hypothetical protein BAUCODRAFT_38499 [Baudoinia panamericana UAMH 10762]
MSSCFPSHRYIGVQPFSHPPSFLHAFDTVPLRLCELTYYCPLKLISPARKKS